MDGVKWNTQSTRHVLSQHLNRLKRPALLFMLHFARADWEEALPSGSIKHFKFISECRLSKGNPSMNIL